MRKLAWFSRKPLNFETWTSRLKSFPRTHLLVESLSDCILAARSLQEQAKKRHNVGQNGLFDSTNILNRRYGTGNGQKRDKLQSSLSGTSTLDPIHNSKEGWKGGYNSDGDFLGVTKKPNRTINVIESKLVDFLATYPRITCTDDVLRKYLLTNPLPQDVSLIIDWTLTSILQSIKSGNYDRNRSLKLVFVALRRLLTLKDYHNAFKLVDTTISLEAVLSANRALMATDLIRYTGGLAITSGIIAIFNVYLAAFWAVSIGIWTLLISRITHHSNKLSRVSWRPHNKLSYRVGRMAELHAVNMILSHYEEHSEVNVRNFHHSKVRETFDPNTIESHGYILEVPEEQENELDKMFQKEIMKRRMVSNELQEELMFLDFWLSQGEQYEWVEPDQDPAEIIELKTQK